MKGTLAGTRIRERRRQLGLKQSTLAEASGISPSYLNLIEHNKRTVSGRVLNAIANELDLPPKDISEGAEAGVLEDLRQVLANHPGVGSSTTAVEEFLGRFPEWAQIVTAQARRLKDNEAAIATFSNRQNFDPHLQNTLHEMLTTITAIRSSSGILTTEETIDKVQRDRFQNVIHDESKRLSDAAQNLVTYFDQAQETMRAGTSAHEIFEHFLTEYDHVFQELDDTENSEKTIKTIIKNNVSKAPKEAIRKIETRLRIYADDAKSMPLTAFWEAAQKHSYAPDRLAFDFSTDLHSVFRRLATLRRKGIDAPHFGLVIVNASGQPLFRRPLEDFSLPRFSSICALWPAFQSLSTPGIPVSDIIALPDGREFFTQAIALSPNLAQFGATPAFLGAMLVSSLNDAYRFGMLDQHQSRQLRPVGTSCSLCLQKDCVARAEPSILPD